MHKVLLPVLALAIVLYLIPHGRLMAAAYVLAGKTVIFNTKMKVDSVGHLNITATPDAYMQDNEWWTTGLFINGYNCFPIVDGKLTCTNVVEEK